MRLASAALALAFLASIPAFAQISTHIGDPFSDGFFAEGGMGPSFDCSEADNRVEKLICEDEVIAQMDLALSASYAAARATAVEEGSTAQSKLRKAQKAWVKRRDACASADDLRSCVGEAYEDRILLLQIAYQQIQPGGYPVERPVENFRKAPRAVMDAVRGIGECDLDGVSSERIMVHDLDLGYELWVVPCWSAAYNFGAALVTVENGKPDSAKVVSLEGTPDGSHSPLSSLTHPTVDIVSGQIYSFHKARGVGDCGIFYRYGWDGRETVRLLELREKVDCDGTWTDPDKYALVYQAW